MSDKSNSLKWQSHSQLTHVQRESLPCSHGLDSFIIAPPVLCRNAPIHVTIALHARIEGQALANARHVIGMIRESSYLLCDVLISNCNRSRLSLRWFGDCVTYRLPA